MTISADTWQARAALCELLALSFRYPENRTLADAVACGEWGEAADEIAGVLGLAWDATSATGAAEVAAPGDPAELHRALRAEATRLFVGAPTPAVSPYEGVWRAADDGVQALLFVNPHSMEVERFCKACGLDRPEGTNEPLDAVATELELLEYLALRAASDAAEVEGAAAAAEVEGAGELDAVDADEIPSNAEGGAQVVGELDAGIEGEGAADLAASGEEPGEVVASADLPGGSPEAAWNRFMAEHAKAWMPRFAEAVAEQSREPFYRAAARLLGAFVG